MTTAYDDWVARDPARHATEVDFGTTWTTDRHPGETWRLSWNTGSGELIAVTDTGDDIEVLGRFDTADDVNRALPDWGRRAQQPDGLDAARHDLAERERRLNVTSTSSPVYGMVIRPDGSTSALHEPVSLDCASAHVGTDVLDVAPVRHDMTEGSDVHMFVDDLGHAKGLPLNPVATVLYGTGWPILGPAVVFDDDGAPLPRFLSTGLDADPAPGSGVEHAAEAALDEQAGPHTDPGPDLEADTDMDLS